MKSSRSQFNVVLKCCIAVLLCAPGLSGCGGSAEEDRDFPPPGTMRVMSSTRLDSSVQAKNILVKGDFTAWWAGAPTPTGYFGPGAEYSKLERVWSSSGFIAHQQWPQADFGTALPHFFRTGSHELTRNSSYRLSVVASECTGCPVGMSIWVKQSGKWELYRDNVIVIPQMLMGAKRYSVDFTPDRTAEFLLTTQPATSMNVPVSIHWHEWTLRELGNE